MTRYHIRPLIYILFLTKLLTASCNGQVPTNPSEEAIRTPKPNPQIVGIPPTFTPQPGIPHDTLLVSQYIRCIFQDSKGNFWFGPAGQSVARYDEKTLQYYGKDEFFAGNNSIDTAWNSIHAIAEDKQGNIWFGTDHGAVRYNGKTFNSYTEKHGLSNINVGRGSILIDKSGDIWIGTWGGVFRYIPSADSIGGKCFSLFHLLPPIPITDIIEDNAGNIWFATQDKGVFCYDGKAVTNIIAKEGLGNGYVGSVIQDKRGNFWFTMKGGICQYDGKTFTELSTKDGLGGDEVWGIYIETSGIIWISARGSTTRYDPSLGIPNPKAFTVFTTKDGINCCVQSMYQDRSGNMWWGAGQGLYRFGGKRFYQVKQNGPW